MAEPNRIPDQEESNALELDGFDQIFSETGEEESLKEEKRGSDSFTTSGESNLEKVVERLSELITLCVDQRIETSKISNQLLENQRQLIATQQILIKLMESSIETTRHVTSIEERLPGVFELPRIVESLRERVAELEAVEYR